MKRFALVLMLLSAPAMAQDVETVTSSAASLAGLWKITWPAPGESEDASSHVAFYCRIEQTREAPSVYCFERQNGTLTVADGKLRILWSPPLTPQSNVIDATMVSADSFTGSDRVRMAGITVLRFELTGTRQQVDPQTRDAAGKASQLRLVLDEMAHGPLSRPYEKTAQVDLPGLEMLRRLGPVKSTTYLARTPIWRDGAWVRDFFSLYLVDFQNGNRLCGLHQRDDGVLDAFRCV